MFKRLILLISISFLFNQEISNLTVGQMTDGSGLIQVSYDLIDSDGTYPSFTIEIQVSIDGDDFESYAGGDVSGDVGENVIPGTNKTLYIQAPDETYSSNVVVKIIASAHVVTSELPFTMISISSAEGVSSYQDESISYSYEIMQNEMTNAELVTFLETYDFQLDADEAPTYNCGEYTEYYNTGMDGGDTSIGGCQEGGALNYNPSATYSSGDCIYESQIGCSDFGAYNYNSGTYYDDCSCYYTNSYYDSTEDTEDCSWNEMCYGPGQDGYNCNYNADQDLYYIDITGDGMSEFITRDSHALIYQTCDDESALNYPTNVLNVLENLNIQPGCLILENSDADCEYECDQSYLDIDDGEGEDDYGSINIEDFSTQSISFEGSSYVIESGMGTQPAIFNYENCVDGVVLGLLLDHYGLRIPTGGEWTKAAREDNTRCWPWLESDCDAASESYCNSIYTCMSDEEYEACELEASDLMLECSTTCNSDSSSCNQGCQGDGGGDDADCGSIDYYDTCENTPGCVWEADMDYCLDECYDCMMDPDNISDCSGNPCADNCDCCLLCDGGGDSYDYECNEDCNIEMMSCMNDCGNTYNEYDYCDGQGVNDCNNCMMNTFECEGVNSNNLLEYLNEDNYEEDGDGILTSNWDQYGFYRHLYSNKFHYINESGGGDGGNASYIDVIDIAQYPDGISPFGLYDMIGNAPEVVKYNNNLWLVGIHPEQDYIGSFCANDGSMFDEDDYNIHAVGLSNGHGSYYNLYGLRLARTTQ